MIFVIQQNDRIYLYFKIIDFEQSMGSSSSFKKDPNIVLFLQKSKTQYLPGEIVQGNIYLSVKAQSFYDAIYLRLEGKQYCFWSQGSGKNRRSYSNFRSTYLEQFIVYSFKNYLDEGQYVFPYSFALPLSMNGNFYYNEQNYIKYTLQASLNSFQKKNDNQIFQLQLLVNQPLKSPFGNIKRTSSVVSKCCGCCKSYGKTTIFANCDKNFYQTGDQINVKATIDNSQGQKDLDNVSINIIQKKLMISEKGRQSPMRSETFNLFNYRQKNQSNQIKKGEIKQIALTSNIPEAITMSTAIGAITALWFQLQVLCQLGYCTYKKPQCNLQLLIHSRNPTINSRSNVEFPQNWRPKVFPKVFYNSMKPFLYQPMASIADINAAFIGPGQSRGGFIGGMMPNLGKQQVNSGYNIVPNFSEKEYGFKQRESNQQYRVL